MKSRSHLINSAKQLQRLGQRGDSVLAHINPAEARYLKEHFGGDINPYTGLPQYGLFRSFGKIFKKAKKLLPVAGSIIGGMLGGPAGAIAGGSLAGALSSKKHKLDHAAGGGLVGLGYGLAAPAIGRSLDLDPNSMMGKATMMAAPSLLDQIGNFGRGSPEERTPEMYAKQETSSGLNSIFGGAGGSNSSLGNLGSMFGPGNLINTALLATALNGVINGKAQMPAYGTPENESMQQAIQRNKHDWGPREQYFPPIQKRNEPKFAPKGYRGTRWNFFPTAQEQQEQIERVNEEMAQEGYKNKYAKGGKIKGYYKGRDGGQDDTIPTNIPKDSYVMDATTVSLVGDGNSENGAYRIAKEVEEKDKNFAKSGFVRNPKTSENVRALLSNGEEVITPEQVMAFGGGSIKKGHKELDKFRKNIRKHKGVTKFIPPKSKPLNKYLSN